MGVFRCEPGSRAALQTSSRNRSRAQSYPLHKCRLDFGPNATMFPVPTAVFLTRGVGVHRHQLTAFEYALREADIEQQNSRLRFVDSASWVRAAPDRAWGRDPSSWRVTFCVMARAETSEPGRRIAASIGMARPKDPTVYGYISEHHGFGMTETESGDYAEDLAASMLAPHWASSSTRTPPGTSAGRFTK